MDDEANATRPANLFDWIGDIFGRFAAWLTLLMVIVTFVIVVMRYVFDAGFIWLQESVTWMHATVFMIGAAYTLRHEQHVRVDIFYRDMSAKRRALVNLFGVVVFLLPLCVFIALKAWDFVAISWTLKEASRESGGLPYPFIPMLKSMLLIMPVMVALQGISLSLHALETLMGPSGEP